MIIVCPECEAKYDVKAEVISVDGLMMKCHKCKSSWFHEGVSFQEILDESGVPDRGDGGMSDDDVFDKLNQIQDSLDEELYEDEALGVDIGFLDHDVEEEKVDINTSVSDGASVDALIDNIVETNVSKKKAEEAEIARKKKVSGGIAAGVFTGLLTVITLFVIGVLLRDSVMEKFPASKTFYASMKFDIPTVGEGLVFDQVSTEWSAGKLEVSGQVINLLMDDSIVPEIEVQFLTVDEEVLDSGRFSTEEDTVSGEDSLFFLYEFQAMKEIEEKTASIRLRFLPVQ